MKCSSTAGRVKGISLKQAVFDGFSKDGGLYLPERFPQFTKEELKKLRGLSFLETSIFLAKKIFEEEFPSNIVEKLCEEAFDFPIPFFHLQNNIYFTELFHGPTLSFKDFGARFLARMIHYWNEEAVILVATSGDTGSAVGRAFLRETKARVCILFPKGKVAPLQEMQLTTVGKNVATYAIDGTFEDCQNLVKKAVLDPDLPHVTTGNSINIGRCLPQAFYYFYSFLQLGPQDEKVIFSIPSGNFGHLVSGIFAERMGLPALRFLAATNINDVIPLFIKSGVFKPHAAYSSFAVSMDVGNPSNFPRLWTLFQSSLNSLREKVTGSSYTDEEIKSAIKDLYENKGYLLDPHSATALLALKDYFSLEKIPEKGIFFATAHPAKFKDELSFAKINVPEQLKDLAKEERRLKELPNDYSELKSLLQKSLVFY